MGEAKNINFTCLNANAIKLLETDSNVSA